MSNKKRLAELKDSPQAFRDVLMIETGGGDVCHFGDVIESWQECDFSAMDPGWRFAVGRTKEAPPFSRSYWERPRGHSKSTDIAVQVCWSLFSAERSVYGVVVAGSRDQARIIRDFCQKLLNLNPWLEHRKTDKGSDIPGLQINQYRVVHTGTNSQCEIVSADDKLAYGKLTDFLICDELTHWSDAGEDLWHAILSTAAKRERCLLTVIANAGFGEGESWQWRVKDACENSPDWHFSRLDGPQASWITERHLDEQERMLPGPVFERLWYNRWTVGEGDAISQTDIQRAINRGRDSGLIGPISYPEDGWVYLAGLDLGIRNDRSALVVIGLHLTSGKVRLCQVHSWRPVQGKEINLQLVENMAVQLHHQFHFRKLVYDSYQAIHMAQRLRRHSVPMHEITFAGSNLDRMATATINRFVGNEIELYDEPQLVRDLGRLRVVEKAWGVKLEAPRDKDGHADTAIALAMALAFAQKESIYLDDPFADASQALPPKRHHHSVHLTRSSRYGTGVQLKM